MAPENASRRKPPSSRRKGGFEKAWASFNTGAGIGLRLLLAALVVAILANYFRQSIVIRPISVTKTLSDEGFSDAVVAEELREHIYEIRQSVSLNDKVPMPAALSVDQPDITVPTTGISLNTILDLFSDVLPWSSRTVISGVFTGDATQVRLVVLVNGKQVYYGASRPAPGSVDALIDGAAQQVIASTHPAWVAVYWSQHGRTPDADRELDQMIFGADESPSDVAEAHALRGMFRIEQESPGSACDEFKKSLAMNPYNPDVYRYLSELMLTQKNLEPPEVEAAAGEAKKSVILSWGRDSWAYYELGFDYDRESKLLQASTSADTATLKLREAEGAYRSAIRLWDENRLAHNALGLVEEKEGENASGLVREADFKEALYEFSRAIAMGPTYADPLENRGIFLVDEEGTPGSLWEAREDFTAASRVGTVPTVADIYLGQVDLDLSQYDNALKEFSTALQINHSASAAYKGAIQSLEHEPWESRQAVNALRRIEDPRSCASSTLPSVLTAEGVVRRLVQWCALGERRAVTSPASLAAPCAADVGQADLLPSEIMFYSLGAADAVESNASFAVSVVMACGAVALLAWLRYQRLARRRDLGTAFDRDESRGRREPRA